MEETDFINNDIFDFETTEFESEEYIKSMEHINEIKVSSPILKLMMDLFSKEPVLRAEMKI